MTQPKNTGTSKNETLSLHSGPQAFYAHLRIAQSTRALSSMKSSPGDRKINTNSKKILLTSLSAMVAETSTFPIDLIKTRLQLRGQSQSLPTSNAFKLASQILCNDGVFGFYNGLSPAILRHLFYTPIRIVGYEHLRTRFVHSDHPLSLSSKAILGGISGAIAQVSYLPFFFFI